MKLSRRILRSEPGQRVLALLAALYIRFVYATSRWQIVGAEIPERLKQTRRPFIGCFWHGRLMMMSQCWDKGRPFHMLISHHRDGQIIARIIAHLGISTIGGSTSRGGGAALRGLVREVKQGNCVGITPDGPRGPRMRASIGIAQVARLTGAPVVPAAYSYTPRRVLDSWDRFVLPLPFGRGVFVWGEPIAVPPDADDAALEKSRLEIEAKLNAVTEAADVLCGQTPVAPAGETWTPEPEEQAPHAADAATIRRAGAAR